MKAILVSVSAAALIAAQTPEAQPACRVPATAAPGTCDHAINTKGTGATGRTAGADHAINSKGTGAAGRAAAPGPGNDCDDDDDGSDTAAAGQIAPPTAGMAIKCKGTGAK